MLNPADSTSQVQNRKEGEVKFHLPDEISVEILSWLPVWDVLRLRSVCKRWRYLTCTQNFTLLHVRRHLRRSLPMVLLYEYCFEDSESIGYDHSLLDQWWDPLQTTPKIYRFGKVTDFDLKFSNGGLIVMEYFRDYMIMNPLYPEKVYITLSEEFHSCDIYGVFFHPSLKEYCTLWRISVSGESTEYKILNLGSRPSWRDINNPWNHRARIPHILPVLIDEHLYWVVEPEGGYTMGWSFPADIMEFDIRKEEFAFISSPIPGPYRCNGESNFNLLDIGGLLSLVWTSPFEDPRLEEQFEVNIWTLKDHASQLWTRSSYIIDVDFFFFNRCPMALVNDELVLHDSREIFTCNLKLGTARKFGSHLCAAGSFTTHFMSLACLRYCKSEIYMDKKGEVEKTRKRRRWDMLDGADENPVPTGNKERSYHITVLGQEGITNGSVVK